MAHKFSLAERSAVYRAIEQRRDVRQFVACDLGEEVLRRLLAAAHAAPSVGFMQPWDFVVVRDRSIRQTIRDHVLRQKEKAGRHYKNERAELYQRLKVEGIVDSSLVIAVTCDSRRGGAVNLGRVTMPQTARFSVCAAIENFWLAARAEGLGVGWVSILEPSWLKTLLNIPRHIEFVALLCVGAAQDFPKEPVLQTSGWRKRESLEKLVHSERWGRPYAWSREALEAKR